MHHFQSLSVSDIRRETPSCVSIALDATHHQNFLDFIPGQYLTFKLNIDGSEVRRSYSICSAPGSQELRVAVKAVEDGFVSVYLTSKVQVGDMLEVMGPDGNFVPQLRAGQQKHYVLFGAGSGITPLKSIIHGIIQEEEESRVTLFFGNSSHQDIIFRESLEALALREPRFKFSNVLTDGSLSPEFSGRIDAPKTLSLLDTVEESQLPREYFICGPSGMMQEVIAALKGAGVQDDHIHTEYFSVPDEAEAPVEVSAPAEPFTGEAEITVVLDDEEIEFALSENGPVVLEAALEAGVDAPFSCKGGVCTTCKAKLESGTVRMNQNYALTDGEIAEGYILTCQSHPTSAKVRINYDEA